jgi:hypothetical protein
MNGQMNGRMNGRRKERTGTMDDPRTLRDEVRQSLSLIAMTALTLLASIAFGLLVGHVG